MSPPKMDEWSVLTIFFLVEEDEADFASDCKTGRISLLNRALHVIFAHQKSYGDIISRGMGYPAWPLIGL